MSPVSSGAGRPLDCVASRVVHHLRFWFSAVGATMLVACGSSSGHAVQQFTPPILTVAATGGCTDVVGDHYCSHFVPSVDFTPSGQLTTAPSAHGSTSQRIPDLTGWTAITFNQVDYMCQTARLGTSADLDCGRYDGGKPSSAFTPDLRCSERPNKQFDCTTKHYYPRELYNYSSGTIGGTSVLCSGVKCWDWFDFSPNTAVNAPPSYVCVDTQHCTPVR